MRDDCGCGREIEVECLQAENATLKETILSWKGLDVEKARYKAALEKIMSQQPSGLWVGGIEWMRCIAKEALDPPKTEG